MPAVKSARHPVALELQSLVAVVSLPAQSEHYSWVAVLQPCSGHDSAPVLALLVVLHCSGLDSFEAGSELVDPVALAVLRFVVVDSGGLEAG